MNDDDVIFPLESLGSNNFSGMSKSDLSVAIKHLSAERGLPREVVVEAIEAALISAYKKTPQGTAQFVSVTIDPSSGKPQVFADKEVVDEVKDDRTQITLPYARRIDPKVKLGDVVKVDVTPYDFGRIAAQTAKQVILQRIREAERDQLFSTYSEREGEIVQGTVQTIDSTEITIALDKVEARLPKKEQIPKERYFPNQRLRVYIVEVKKSNKGPEITVSRTHRNMLRRLLEVEVPEIFNGAVEIKAIAREAGSRSKVAVAARQDGIDPVGACVGLRGVRIQALVNELGGEKIDIIEWSPDSSLFIAKALSPALVMSVNLEDGGNGKTANVVVPDKQLSLAIGKEGQNARLAAKLTGWRIDIKSESEAKAEQARLEEQAKIEEERKAKVAAARDLLRLAEEADKQQAVEAVVVEPPEAVAVEPEIEVAPAIPEVPVEETVTPEIAEIPTPVTADAAAELVELVAPPIEPEGVEPEPVTAVAPEVEAAPIHPVVEGQVIEDGLQVLIPEIDDEEDEDEETSRVKKKGKAKGKKGQYRELLFDPRLGEVVSKKKHKPGRKRHDWEDPQLWQVEDLDEEVSDDYFEHDQDDEVEEKDKDE